MSKRKVIANKNLPQRLPLFQTITAALAMDHWYAPDIIRGVIWTILVILWAICIYSLYTQEQVDVINPDK